MTRELARGILEKVGIDSQTLQEQNFVRITHRPFSSPYCKIVDSNFEFLLSIEGSS